MVDGAHVKAEGGAAGVVDPARLVFVGGLHRSGTTALARALADHPQVSGLSGTGVKENEGQHLQPVYPAANTHGGPGRFAWSARAHLTEDSELATPDAARRMLEAWAPHWDLDRQLLVEKSPPNLLMTRFLQRVFPGSAMIVVVRHPIVVALSTRKWARATPLARLVAHNLHAYETFARDAAHLDRLVTIRYEDLVAEPDRVLGQVVDLLGLREPLATSAIGGGHSTRYEDMWAGYASGSLLKRAERRVIEQLYAKRLARWGYDAKDLTRLGPWTPPVTGGRVVGRG